MRQSLMCFLFLPCIAFGCSEPVDVTPAKTDTPASTESATPGTGTDAGTKDAEPAAE
ncbi:MAG: hypothetical protein H7Z17_01320 [Fuerstia sp.]|nr:hypothetical protein [Fuerstiella sp.]